MCPTAQEFNYATSFASFLSLQHQETDPIKPVPVRHVSTENLFSLPGAQHPAANDHLRRANGQGQATSAFHGQGFHALGLLVVLEGDLCVCVGR